MNKEDKELLLKDLCARLPYGVIGLYSWKKHEPYNKELTGNLFDELTSSWNSTEDSEFLPYLRPMSSMTEEEFKEWLGYCKADYDCEFKPEPTFNFESCHLSINWLNQHHFDYRGLIEKGLALEAPEEMYK